MARTDFAPQLCAPFVSGDTTTPSSSALQIVCGTTLIPPSANMLPSSSSFTVLTNHFAWTGNKEKVARHDPTTKSTCAPVASHYPIELSHVLELRHLQPICPYNVVAWESSLHDAGLLERYSKISKGFRLGFDLNLPLISISQLPPNNPSLLQHRLAFDTIIDCELLTGHYMGPFTKSHLSSLLSPFQMSPVSIIPKPGKPGKYRVIQKISFPHSVSPHFPQPSINSGVNLDEFPCTWGTFDTVCAIICHLPPGSQGTTCDMAKAYCMIPLLPSQWPAAVVCVDDNSFFIDTCISFSMGPSAGYVADTGADLL